MLRIPAIVFLLVTAPSAWAISAGVYALPETCNNLNGRVWGQVIGGQAPYTYAWTGPNGYRATTDSIAGLDAGEY
nr:hypothetical protein [Flavobacteriales bacterium]